VRLVTRRVPNFWRATARYGFMERPDIPELLERAPALGCALQLDEALAASVSRTGGAIHTTEDGARPDPGRDEGIARRDALTSAPPTAARRYPEVPSRLRGATADSRVGDRGRTGDVQLGKLFDEGPEDYDPWGQFEWGEGT
jgi:hypothetical protein